MAKRMALVNASWLMCWGMFKKPEFLILWAGFEQPHFLVKLKSSWASFRHSASSFFDSVEFVPIFEAFGPSTSPYGSQQGGICYTEMVGASSSAKVRLGVWDTHVLRQLFSSA